MPGPLATSDTVVWRVTFSEGVTGVDSADFELTSVAGSASGMIASVIGSDSEYTVTVSSLSGSGELRLDLNPSGTGIANGSGTALPGGYTSGQTYRVANSAAVIAWGDNHEGELGDGSAAGYSAVPVAVLGMRDAVAVSTGSYHSLALNSSGQVYAWGKNDSGQLGNGTVTDSNLPVAVSTVGALSGKTVIAIAAGEWHSLALTSDGRVFSWGKNHAGQLGEGSTVGSVVPVPVTMSGALASKKVIAISAGGAFSLALASDGGVYGWGYNGGGQLGDGTTTNRSVPVATSTSGALTGKTVVSISTGSIHSVVLTCDGGVYTWGANYYDQLGVGQGLYVGDHSSVPVPVKMSGQLSGKRVVEIAAGGFHNFVLTSDGRLYGWGDNAFGQLGDSSLNNRDEPVPVGMNGALLGESVATMAAGFYTSQALTSDGSAHGWGYNSVGVIGDGTLTDREAPVDVDMRASSGSALAGRTVYQLGMHGGFHAVALASPFAPSSVGAPAKGWYMPGDVLAFTVIFPQPVIVDTAGGTARLALTVGSTTRYATYVSGSHSNSLTFSYAVQVGDADTDGIGIAAAVGPNGGSLTDLAGNEVGLGFPLPDTSGIFVGRPPDYSAWADGNFTATELADPAISGAEADPDGSGMSNLLRYAFDLPARGPVAAPTRVERGGSGSSSTLMLAFPIRAEASDLVYEVQSSSDLVNWITEQSYAADKAKRTISYEIAETAGVERLFLRVRVLKR